METSHQGRPEYHPTYRPEQHPPRAKTTKLKLFAGGILLTALLSGTGIAIATYTKLHQSPIPKEIRSAVSFPLYYPKKLLPGMTLNKDSFSATSEVVTFNFNYDSGKKKLIVSEQPLSGIDPDTFNPTKKFTTGIGTAYLVDLEDRTTAAVIADKSWLLINAPQKMGVDDMEQFINSLRPAK